MDEGEDEDEENGVEAGAGAGAGDGNGDVSNVPLSGPREIRSGATDIVCT